MADDNQTLCDPPPDDAPPCEDANCPEGERCRSVFGVQICISDENYDALFDNSGTPPTTPQLIGKKRTVYNSELFYIKSTREDYYALNGQASTPWEHVNTSWRSGDWQVYADNREGDTNARGLDRFRYVIGTHYGQQDGHMGLGPLIYFNDADHGGTGGLSLAPGDSTPSMPFRIGTISGKQYNPDANIELPDGLALPGTVFRQWIPIWKKDQGETGEKLFSFDGTEDEFYLNWRAYVAGGPAGPSGDINLPPLFNIDPANMHGRSLMYEDYSFELEVPLFPSELRSTVIRRPLIAEISSNYNFFIKPYEETLRDAISNFGAGERILSFYRDLPDLYVFEFEKQSQNRDEMNTVLNQMITLDNRLNTYLRDIISENPLNGLPGTKIAERDRGDYFYDWARAYDPDITLPFSWRFRQILLDTSNMRFIADINKKKHLFPMYVDLKFGTDRQTKISDLFKEASMTYPLAARLTRNVLNPDLFNIITRNFSSPGNETEPTLTHVQDMSLEIDDIAHWLDRFTNHFDRLNFDGDSPIVLSEKINDYKALVNPDNLLARLITTLIVTGKLTKLVKEHSRSFEQIMLGETAYSETIAYKIIKKRLSPQIGDLGRIAPVVVQTVTVPNNSDIDIFNYIDTQVIYNNEYRYEVFACQIVLGASYYYDELSLWPSGDGANVWVNIFPRIKIIQVPYFTAEAKILDSAPLSPDVNIIPYRGIANKVLFFFNSQTGVIKDDPISLGPEDEEFFRDYRLARNLGDSSPIFFEGDDEIESFEIFRTTRKPTSYSDFFEKLHETVMTEPVGANFDATSAAFVDLIRPNKKYYYIFRARDVHGNVSNPTAVYEVEMALEDGAVFPLINIYNMEPADPYDSSRTFKRYLYVKANDLQSAVMERISGPNAQYDAIIHQRPVGADEPTVENIEDVGGIGVGDVDEQVYGSPSQPKKFKFRIASKRTGRKIDINLNFIHKDVNNL